MEYNTEKVNCNLCGADDIELVSKTGQHGIPINLVLCKNCGLGYLNPRWDANGYIDFYKNQYDKYYRPNLKSNLKKSEVKESSLIIRFRERNLLESNFQNILEIGSGAGENLISFSKVYPDANLSAIEPSQESQKLLQEKGINVLSDDVNSDWDRDLEQKFDLIIMRHVLEHFLDPLTVLRRISEVLTEDGVLYIAVPNNLNPTQDLNKVWFRVVHTYYFNKFSLASILALAGFELIDLVEGDQYNKGEVYLMAKVSENPIKPIFSSDHYKIQREVFEERYNMEKKVSYKIKNKIGKIKRRFLS